MLAADQFVGVGDERLEDLRLEGFELASQRDGRLPGFGIRVWQRGVVYAASDRCGAQLAPCVEIEGRIRDVNEAQTQSDPEEEQQREYVQRFRSREESVSI